MRKMSRSVLYSLICAIAIVASVALNAPARAQSSTLELGLLPHLSTKTLFDVYRPLREYLAKGLQRPVRLVTAPDYRTLIERTRRGDYSYLVTAPHFARLAQKESGYMPLVRVDRDLSAILLTPRTAGIKDLNALRGAVVATPDRLAIISMLGIKALSEAGLVPGTNLTIRAYPTFASAVLAVSTGEAAAAVSAATAFNQMRKTTGKMMMTIAESSSVPGVMIIARSDVDVSQRDAVRELLVKFHLSEAGERFFTRTHFKRYRIPLDSELASLDPYVQQLKAVLAEP